MPYLWMPTFALSGLLALWFFLYCGGAVVAYFLFCAGTVFLVITAYKEACTTWLFTVLLIAFEFQNLLACLLAKSLAPEVISVRAFILTKEVILVTAFTLEAILFLLHVLLR